MATAPAVADERLAVLLGDRRGAARRAEDTPLRRAGARSVDISVLGLIVCVQLAWLAALGVGCYIVLA